MKSIRRLVLLLSFGAIGIVLAVCVGVSTETPAEEKPTEGKSAESVDTANDDQRESTPRVALVENVPQFPQPAYPYPPLAQQGVPGLNNVDMNAVSGALSKLLAEREDSRPAAAANTAPELIPPGAAAAPTTAAPVAPEPPGEAKVTGEGDGKLSIHIKNAEIREVLDMLGAEGDLNILVGKSVQGKVSATLNGVSIDEALDAVLKSTGYAAKHEGRFIFVGTPDEFTAMEQSLDRIGTRVYRPNYVNSTELQSLIQPLLTPDVGVISVSSAAEAGIGADEAMVGGNSFAGAEVVVVRDFEAVLAEVDQMVDEVDIRPLQVHIEAMILSVKLKDTDKYGVDFQFLRKYQDTLKFGIGSPEQWLGSLKFEEGALKVGFLDSNLGAFLEALETIGDTNVIATPRLMVVNKHRAGIQIGDQKGYISTTVTETTSTQTVEFLEVGTILRLRPFISSDGLIRMEVHPELSSGDVTVQGQFTIPQKAVTQVTTNIMVRDGCTVVIGGLMREELATTSNQVPFFGNLPYVGFAFRSSTETTERREVIVLITPRIVYEPNTCEEGEKAACEFHRRQAVYADKMTPCNKRNVARRYFRLAQNAWAAGDRDRALRFAEMAVHFDPLNRKAIDLRANIWSGKLDGDHALPVYGEPTKGNPLDGQVIDEWLLNDLQQEPLAEPAPLHPYDPGQPGPRHDIERPRRLK